MIPVVIKLKDGSTKALIMTNISTMGELLRQVKDANSYEIVPFASHSIDLCNRLGQANSALKELDSTIGWDESLKLSEEQKSYFKKRLDVIKELIEILYN